MIYADNALTVFCDQYAKDLMLCCFGEDAINYAEDFEFTDYHLKKYHDNITANLEYIVNKNVVDIGSNTGLWAVLMYLNGAKSVTCIEPRKQLSDGINAFASMHNLPIRAINEFHHYLYNTTEKFDTVVMMGIDDLISDIILFITSLKNVANYLLLKTKNTNELVDNNSIKLDTNNHNFYHRSGFSLGTVRPDGSNPLGYQTNITDFIHNPTNGRFIRYLYGKNFYDTLFDLLDYQIVNFNISSTTDGDVFKFYTVKLI